MKSPNKMMGSIAGAIGGNSIFDPSAVAQAAARAGGQKIGINAVGGNTNLFGPNNAMAQAAARAAGRGGGQNTAGSIIGGTMVGAFNPATMGMQPPTELSPEEQERESLRMYGSGAGDLDVFGNLKNGINSDFSKSVQDDQLEYEENLTPTTPTMAENEAKLRNPIGKELQPMNAINMENKGESGQLNTFSDRTNQVASQALGKMFSTPVALKTNTPIKMKTDPGAIYSAMDALKSAQNLDLSQLGKTNYRRDTASVSKSLALPGLPTSSTGGGAMSGSYSNPTSTGAGTTANTSTPASSTPQYSFLENNNVAKPFDMTKLSNPEHRSGFMGFYKRNAPSIQARIDDATAEGKTRKVTRLNKKMKNFTDYQAGKGKGFVGRALQGIGNIFK